MDPDIVGRFLILETLALWHFLCRRAALGVLACCRRAAWLGIYCSFEPGRVRVPRRYGSARSTIDVTCDCSIIKIIRTDTTSLPYRKAGLGGEPYKGETPPDLPVLTS